MVPRLFQQADPVTLTDLVADLGLAYRDMLTVLDGVAGQVDLQMDAARAPVLLDELQLPVADIESQLQRLIDAKLRQAERLRLRLERREVRPDPSAPLQDLDAPAQPQLAADDSLLLAGQLESEHEAGDAKAEPDVDVPEHHSDGALGGADRKPCLAHVR